MSIHRVHFIQSVYVGPTEPYDIVPPVEALDVNDRAREWTITEGNGGVTVTHHNPRALTRRTADGRDVIAPYGQAFSTFVPFANVRGIQYVPTDVVGPKAAK